jgi:outer membrane protein
MMCGNSIPQTTADGINSDSPESPIIGYSLEDFFNAAIINSPRLKIATETLKIGEARRNNANSQLLPQLRANANLSDNTRISNDISQTFDGNRYSVQLTQTLFNWEAFAERSKAYLREDIAEAEYYSQLSNLLTDVAEKYFDALRAQDALSSVSSELLAIKNQLQQTEQLYSRQLAQITDLYSAQASVAATESQQVQLESQMLLSINALRSVSGIEAGELHILSDTADLASLDSNLGFWLNEAEINSPLIKTKKLEVKTAEKSVSQRKGGYLPQVSLIVQRQDTDVGFDNMPMMRSDNTFIGLDVSVPIYSGGSKRALLREAKSFEQIAISELRQVQLDVSARVRAAYLAVQGSSGVISAARKFLEFATLNADAMQTGFDLGATTSVDVLDALRDQYRAERELQRVRYDYIKSLLSLQKEAGTLNAKDLVKVSSWLIPTTTN